MIVNGCACAPFRPPVTVALARFARVSSAQVVSDGLAAARTGTTAIVVGSDTAVGTVLVRRRAA